MIESIRLEAWGIETGLVKTRGKITGTLSYTYSRSEREWPAPDRRNTYYFKQTHNQLYPASWFTLLQGIY